MKIKRPREVMTVGIKTPSIKPPAIKNAVARTGTHLAKVGKLMQDAAPKIGAALKAEGPKLLPLKKRKK